MHLLADVSHDLPLSWRWHWVNWRLTLTELGATRPLNVNTRHLACVIVVSFLSNRQRPFLKTNTSASVMHWRSLVLFHFSFSYFTGKVLLFCLFCIITQSTTATTFIFTAFFKAGFLHLILLPVTEQHIFYGPERNWRIADSPFIHQNHKRDWSHENWL